MLSGDEKKKLWIFSIMGITRVWYGWREASKSFCAPWIASVIMVILLTPTVARACSSPRHMDIISASVEVILVACIFGF